MANVKEQFLLAKELIQNQQYNEARQILYTIDHPSAQAWLARVDEFDPPTHPPEQADPQEESGGWISRIIGFIKRLLLGTADNPRQEVVAEDPPQAQYQQQVEETAAEEEQDEDLRGSDMAGAYLRYAQLDGVDLEGSNFTGAYLFGANLVGANLTDANFTGANLIGANLAGAIVDSANFSEAHLIGANLIGANFESAYLNGAKLPDKTGWTDSTDMTRFTNPNHPDFWQPVD